MHLMRFGRKIILASGLLTLLGVAACSRRSAQPSPAAQNQPAKASPPQDLWRSETTDKEYQVKINADTLQADWVNLPRDLAGQGFYVRTECRRQGTKWLGTSKIFLPCSIGHNAPINQCHLLMHIEIDSITEDRITGRVEDPVRDKFDCRKCEAAATDWKDFIWEREH